ncbi:AraC family transcriptional regulator [Mycolicibacterium sp. P9-64]|nr:AraC family transcriptional regulator [Mycolicibacterium sp. P9-64]
MTPHASWVYLGRVFDVRIGFAPGTRARAEVLAVRRTNLHAHWNALEIVYVLRGSLHVVVSSETFDLDAGDYVVLNRMDPHLLEGSVDNVTALVHLDLPAFGDVHPLAGDIMFACESFDLPRYRKQEALLRGLLLDVIDDGAVALDATRLDDRAAELVRLMCAGYSIADYYQRDRPLTGTQREKLLSIMAYVRAHLDSRDILDDVAREHHYSKSYVSHFVKDTAAISFSNVVTASRVMHAETLLLTTEHTMRDIASLSGFSDVKYLTRCFLDWFKQTPAEYRAANLPATLRDNDVETVAADAVAGLIHEHRRRVASPTDGPRLSITPILLKNVGTRADLFEKIRKFETDDAGTGVLARAPGAHSGRQHLLPMRVGHAELESGYLVRGLASFLDNAVTPCVVLEYAGRDATIELVNSLARQLRTVETDDIAVWLVYSGSHARPAVDQIIDAAHDEHGLTVQAILMP